MPGTSRGRNGLNVFAVRGLLKSIKRDGQDDGDRSRRVLLDNDCRDHSMECMMALRSFLCISPSSTSGSLACLGCTSQFFIGHREASNGAHGLTQFGKRDTNLRIDGEDALQDLVAGVRYWQDVWQELWILDECAEGIVIGRGLPPRIAAAGEIDENDAQSPDIVLASGIGANAFEDAAIAFYGIVSEVVDYFEELTTNQDSCSRSFRTQSLWRRDRWSQARSRTTGPCRRSSHTRYLPDS